MMDLTDEFTLHNRCLAKRFLRTAVVLDDEAYMIDSDMPSAEVISPGRDTQSTNEEDQSPKRKLSLDARSIMDSFWDLGIICGVINPNKTEVDAVRQADIVILDWLLQDGSYKYTLQLLRQLLTEDRDRNALRLVAIYTGEARLSDIYKAIVDELDANGFDPQSEDTKTSISYRYGRMELYVKEGVNLAEKFKQRKVPESDLPSRLVDDFADMTAGLVSSIALTSLIAVREGEHKLLNRFGADLDPAFLAHKTCLPDPVDAEQQIVIQIAEEIRGLVSEAVATESPAGRQAVERWIQHDKRTNFKFGGQELSASRTIELVNDGLEKNNYLKERDFKKLSSGFALGKITGIDKRLAWIMSFRTVYSAPPPTLWLGSVVTMKVKDDEQHLICMRPRCDCVRLDSVTNFIFLPLLIPEKKFKTQLVVRFDDEFKRLAVDFDSGLLIQRKFKPSDNSQTVVAVKRPSDDSFEFTDTEDTSYIWRGELKSEYSQRLAHAFSSTLDRIAVVESEWIRKKVKFG